MDLERLSKAIGYRFRDEELLHRALTHASHSAAHNERLEFLGDSVVNCAVALELYSKFHNYRSELYGCGRPRIAAVDSRGRGAHDSGHIAAARRGKTEAGGASVSAAGGNRRRAFLAAAF